MNRKNKAENLNQVFQSMEKEYRGKTVSSPAVFLTLMLDDVRYLRTDVPAREKRRYQAKYTGNETVTENRVYRNVEFIIPESGTVFVERAIASWNNSEDGTLRDCRLDSVSLEQTDYRSHLYQTLKKSCLA